MSKQFKIVDGDISDGYHTFGELYDHRCVLYVLLCKSHNGLGWSWKHDENTPGWFLLYWQTPYGQISYHLPSRFISDIQGIASNVAPEWDGHTSKDVLQRLNAIAQETGTPEAMGQGER